MSPVTRLGRCGRCTGRQSGGSAIPVTYRVAARHDRPAWPTEGGPGRSLDSRATVWRMLSQRNVSSQPREPRRRTFNGPTGYAGSGTPPPIASNPPRPWPRFRTARTSISGTSNDRTQAPGDHPQRHGSALGTPMAYASRRRRRGGGRAVMVGRRRDRLRSRDASATTDGPPYRAHHSSTDPGPTCHRRAKRLNSLQRFLELLVHAPDVFCRH